MATTYYVDAAAGNDANAGTSPGAGNAWATLSKAATIVVAGDSVNAKGSASYNEILTLTTSGTAGSPIVWSGYTTTVGDGGRAIIDGQNTRATCLSVAATLLNGFNNFTFQGGTTRIIGNT